MAPARGVGPYARGTSQAPSGGRLALRDRSSGACHGTDQQRQQQVVARGRPKVSFTLIQWGCVDRRGIDFDASQCPNRVERSRGDPEDPICGVGRVAIYTRQ
jgi:hypothetical protein